MTFLPQNIVLESEKATLTVGLGLQLRARLGPVFLPYGIAAGLREGNRH